MNILNKMLGVGKNDGGVALDSDSESIKIKKLTEQDGVSDGDLGKSEEPPVEDDVENEDAPDDSINKEYVGKTDDTHFYLVTSVGKEGDEPSELQILDQDGTVKFTSKDQNIDASNPTEFLIKAIEEVEMNEITRSIFTKYILPKLEKEETPEDKESLEDTDEGGMTADDMKPDEMEEGKVALDKDSESAKIKKLIEKTVNYGGKDYEVSLVDDGTLDTVIDINGHEQRFDWEFASYWRDEETGELSDEGLEELALDALSSMEPEELDELSGEVPDEDDIAQAVEGDEDDEPQEEDLIYAPSGNLGSKLTLSQVGGKEIGTYNSDDEVIKAAKDWMEQNNFYPNLWFIDDHGESQRVEVTEKKKCPAALKKHMFKKGKKESGKCENESRINECVEGGYVSDDRSSIGDYNEAGVFDLETAAEICKKFEDGVISPDASGKYVVIIKPKTIKESKIVDDTEIKESCNRGVILLKKLLG